MIRPFALCAAVGLCASLLGGCAEDSTAVADEPTPTVLDDQLKVMDQAKAVEQQLQDAKSQTDAALDKQSN